MISILQTRKVKLREAKPSVHGHTAKMSLSEKSNLIVLLSHLFKKEKKKIETSFIKLQMGWERKHQRHRSDFLVLSSN